MGNEIDDLVAKLRSMRKRVAAQTELVRETGTRHIAEMKCEAELRRQYAALENKPLSLIAGEERYSRAYSHEEMGPGGWD